ncbi:hypothetical protein ANN_06815 [Periplaneta americana]|uniref:Uncharacterized protein n=1 Tax=Periplaneta americana TaxID=6978 RepID=A0ABQ8TEJ1_PERAM|nr:hypothetical protein ANN_06815 [Periplaneta americana]
MVVWMRREERNIRRIRSDLGEHNHDDNPVPTRRHRNVDQQKRVSALETCDIIVSQAEERFRFTGHLAAAKLFRISSFQEYCNRFPEEDFAATVNTYSKVNKSTLRTELEVLYSRVDLRAAEGAAALLQLFLHNNMQETFH